MASRRDFVVVLSGRLVSALIAIASLRVMTTLLPPKDYGIYTLLISFQTFCGLFLINPVGQHINRHTHAWWDDGTLFGRLAKYNWYIGLVSGFIAIVVIFWWQSYPNMDKGPLKSLIAGLVVGAIVYLGTWNGTFVYLLNMLGFRSSSVIWMTVTSVVGLVFAAIFVSRFPNAISWVFGQVVGATVGGLGAWFYLRKHQFASDAVSYQSDTSLRLLDRKTIVTFCIPLATATGFMWLQNVGYRFFVSGVWGVAELGILAIGLGISAQLWSIIESLASQFLYPYFYRRIAGIKADKQSGEALSDLVNVLGPIYAFFAGFNILFASVLLKILTNDRYHAAVVFVMFGAMIEFARCLTNLWSNAAQVKRRTIGVILPWVLGAMTVWSGAIIVAYWGGGMHALSMILVGAGVISCISMIFIMQRLLPITIDIRRWTAGIIVMCICYAVAVTAPIPDRGIYQNLGMLFLGGVSASVCLLVMLWHNPALARLLEVPLRMT